MKDDGGKIAMANSEPIDGSQLRDKSCADGFLNAYLAETILHNATVDLTVCLWIYNNSEGYEDLFRYEACIRDVLGNGTSFGRIKILPKGTGWARDNWMTNSKWSDKRDFMIHNWKLTQLRSYTKTPLPNTTWQYDKNLLTTQKEIDDRLSAFAREVAEKQTRAMSHVQEIRKRWFATRKLN
ncbi:hypothetical protein TELCIR_14289 [Teladorsagia circumcincta]|uniref:Uncharacterized protein n=1 Tax=Teladorsagia circumcincta TaxID=45464 RepID=A0A2G9U1I6_TELCI|nr:hypothetical protein TELCIR_14289 [Teladorsagia circumcincta]